MSASSKKNTEQPDAKPKSARKPTPTKPDEMGNDVLEFITAIDEYKRVHQRQFPGWSEVLEILKTLGYEKAS